MYYISEVFLFLDYNLKNVFITKCLIFKPFQKMEQYLHSYDKNGNQTDKQIIKFLEQVDSSKANTSFLFLF